MGNTNDVLKARSCDCTHHRSDFKDNKLQFKPSKGALLSQDNTTVSLGPNTDSLTVVPINCILNKDSYRKVCIRLKIQASTNSQVIIGFVRPHSLPHPVFIDNMYINISLGRIVCDNTVIHDNNNIAHSNIGGEVTCCIDMLKNIVQYSVTNPGHHPSTITQLSLGTADLPQEIQPMVGVLSTGKDGVTIAIVSPGQPVSNLSSLNGVRFDGSSAFGPVEISANGLIVKRGSNDCNCCVAMNQVMRIGIHRWTLKVLTDCGSSICLGLVRHPLNISHEYTNAHMQLYLHHDLIMWRSYRGYLYANGQKLDNSLEPIGWSQCVPVVVEFVLNLDSGELEIIRNGISMGLAFKSIKGPVCPAVVFYANYEKAIEIIDYRSEENTPSSPRVVPNPQRTTPESSPHLPTTRSNSSPNPIHYSPLAPMTPTQSLPMTIYRRQPSVIFDHYSKCGQLIVSEDGLTLTRTSDMSGNAYCLLNIVCDRGVYRWSFRIEADHGSSTCIGITAEPVNMIHSSKHVYFSESMFLCRSYRGSLFSNGKEMPKSFAEFWKNGSEVELTLDLENNVLHYSINNADQGVAFCGLSNAYHYRPVVAFYAKMDKKISLLKFEHLLPQSKQVNLSNDINNLSIEMEAATKIEDSEATPNMIGEQSAMCMVCSVKDNNVAILPCGHIVYCPIHAETAGCCIVCGVKISGMWNVF